MCSLANNIVSICWILFGVIWIVAAMSSKRTIYRASRGQRLRYTLLLIVACGLLFNTHRLPYPFDLRVIPCTDAIALTCAISCVAGLLFCFWARAPFVRNW